jgi:hypothetical protein
MSAPYRYAVVLGSDGERSLVVHAITQSEWDELVAEVYRLNEERIRLRAWRDRLIAEIDRLRGECPTCPLCPDLVEEMPAMRCMTCGTAFNDEEVD